MNVNWKFYRPKRKHTAAEAAQQFRKRLLAREAVAVRRIRAAYNIAAKAIDRELSAVAKRIDDHVRAGLPVKSGWQLEQERLEQAAKEIHSQIEKFTHVLDGHVKAAQLAQVNGAVRAAAGMARVGGVTSGFKLLNHDQFVDLVGFLDNGTPLYDLFRDIAPRAATQARAVFAQASALGSNPRSIAKKLATEIQNLTETRALVIARDQTMRSYRGATIRTFRANSDVITGWRWQCARQPRTCAMCLAMDGTRHGLDEELESHTCCRCLQVPETEYSTQPVETGADWFAKQTEDIQRQIVGPKKLALIQSGDITLQDLIIKTSHPRWGNGRREATIAEALSKASTRPKAVPMPPPPTAPAPTPKVKRAPKPKAPAQPQWDPHRGAASVGTTIGKRVPAALKRQIESARGVIDKIHGAGAQGQMDRFNLPVKGETKYSGNLGALSFRPGKPIDITINAYGPTPELTFAHEFGHLVDMTATPGPMLDAGLFAHIGDVVSQNATLQVSQTLADAVHQFIGAAVSTEEIDALRKALATGIAQFDGKSEYVNLPGVRYLLLPHEIWARAYAQFIAVRSGHAAMKESVKMWMEEKHLMGRLRQWSPQEFKKVEPAIENLLRALGLMP